MLLFTSYSWSSQQIHENSWCNILIYVEDIRIGSFVGRVDRIFHSRPVISRSYRMKICLVFQTLGCEKEQIAEHARDIAWLILRLDLRDWLSVCEMKSFEIFSLDESEWLKIALSRLLNSCGWQHYVPRGKPSISACFLIGNPLWRYERMFCKDFSFSLQKIYFCQMCGSDEAICDQVSILAIN